ncbi:LCP family protein [Janibacter anophelis]|uniref:LCP family protein n=1 Tax=Janibacter anophelis TaxID=319054 RepID=UPI00083165AB|nr:LCP family protein [Janibacter anophelis]
MRHPFARTAATTVALTLALAACSADGEGDATSSTAPSSTAPTSESTSSSSRASSPSSSSASAKVVGAPAALTRAVAKKYGDHPLDGRAELGDWRGAKVAVVSAGDDVTLAVRPKGRTGWKVVGGWWPSLGAEGKADLGGARHVLVIGSDARPGQDVERSRADAIQLLGVDGKGGAGLMGFARDLWVPIPGHGHGKLNSSMVFAGPSGQVSSVESLSGVDVDGYVVTGFDGFEAIVDEAGGLDFVAPEALDSHLPGGQIAKGRNRLSGKEALAYARERKTLPGGDFDRSRHQGLLLAAAAVQAKLKGPGEVPAMLSVVDEHASSDLSAEEMLVFTASFYRVNPTKVGHAVAQGPTGMQSGQSIVRLDDASKRSFRDFRDGRLS